MVRMESINTEVAIVFEGVVLMDIYVRAIYVRRPVTQIEEAEIFTTTCEPGYY
jgi:hypothetical protein